MPWQVEGDDAEAAGDLAVVQERAVLPAVGAGGVQAKEGNALSRFLEVQALRAARHIEPQVAADDRLERGRADRRHRLGRRRRSQGGEQLLEEQQIAAPRQDLAVESEM